jgi:hypothetical protein
MRANDFISIVIFTVYIFGCIGLGTCVLLVSGIIQDYNYLPSFLARSCEEICGKLLTTVKQ